MIKNILVSGLEGAKTLSAALRDIALPLLVAVLLLWPGVIKQRLVDAGFRKGSIGGLEWEAFNETDEELKAARMKINDLTAQIAKSNEQLVKSGSPAARALIVENRAAAQSAEATVRSVTKQIVTNQQVVEQADAPIDSSSGWAVIFGGDVSPQAAAEEIRRAKDAGISKPQILFRRGSYRSVALFSDRDEAAKQLAVARQQLRPDSYLVELASWCPERREQRDMLTCV